MKKSLIKGLAVGFLMLTALGAEAYRYDYKTVEGDPMNVLQYTLPNGLKVYMSVNKDMPRIQTYISVRVGGKNDPAETTGLAHYFEHLMFKGTKQFGTSDYEAERPLLDQIEKLFETYRQTSDSTARASIYHQIDSISYEASKIAIPNEYDKLMSAIGAQGTNAFTGNDMTCYVEDIPSNQIDNWAKIQADRFESPVLRGFHTELETIYEEKNMSLTEDGSKMIEALFEGLFPHHPYGTQTVLGTQEHLKNPSITNVKKYHDQWYVPNNMAIVMAGDFDPDNALDIITRYFGHLKPNPSLPKLKFDAEKPITSPVEKKVYGAESEMIALGWRLPAASSKEMDVLNLVDNMLGNQGQTGLLDVNINQAQKALGAGCGLYALSDYSTQLIMATPMEGQTLDDVRKLLLEQVEKLRAGDFDESTIKSVVNNYRLDLQRSFESNQSRASMMSDAFINGEEWADVVASIDRMGKVTKADIVEYANRYLGPDNYVAVYKLQGEDPNQVKMPKPVLTPLEMNRDKSSAFLKEVQTSKVVPIEPVFVDYKKELTFGNTSKSNIPVIYKQNTTNDVATLSYVWEYGSLNDRSLGVATDFLDLMDAPGMTQEELKKRLYELACTYWFSVGTNRTLLNITGLSENIPEAMALIENHISNCVADTAVYRQYTARAVKSLMNDRDSEDVNQSRLINHVFYGDTAKSIRLKPADYQTLDPATLPTRLKALNGMEHRIVYYGPETMENVIAAVDKNHKTPATLTKVDRKDNLPLQTPQETVFYIAPYDSKQIKMMKFSCNGDEIYDLSMSPVISLYNNYFGGSMNAIVFQEMRERRSLAYSAWADFSEPSQKDKPYYYLAGIATQNDKMMDAVTAFNEIIDNMPESEAAFDIAKSGLEDSYRTGRIIKGSLAWNYLNEERYGRDYDSRRDIYEKLPSLTMEDLLKFQREHVKGRHFHYAILGNPEDLDLEALKAHGRVVMLTTEDIFGY